MEVVGSSRVRVGISGWRYPPWRGVFYPAGLRQVDELSFASRVFSSIEINGSFYSLQRPTTYQHWHAVTPRDFVFAVKGSRYITHMKRLRDVRVALSNFFASGLLCLGHKLGPVLWQLPPQLPFDGALLERFFELLPRDLREAERLARGHDARLAGRAVVDATSENRQIQHALEVRHSSFVDQRYVDLLQAHGVASCVADSAGLYPVIDRLTAPFAYARLHGDEELYVSGYPDAALAHWAERVRAWSARVKDVYVFFDNDVKVRAPFDALNLRRLLLGLPAARPPASLASVTERPRSDWLAWRRPLRDEG